MKNGHYQFKALKIAGDNPKLMHKRSRKPPSFFDFFGFSVAADGFSPYFSHQLSESSYTPALLA
jgi:hypothetical protein